MSYLAASSFVSGKSLYSQPMHRVSALLAHSKKDSAATFKQVLMTLRASGLFRWLSIRVWKDEDSNHYEFGDRPQSDTEMHLRAETELGGIVVVVDALLASLPQEDAPLFLSFLAQQLALFIQHRDLLAQNQALREAIFQTEEILALRKFMDRAKSLICNHRGFTPAEAEDWLVGASVRYQKPLLSVARDIVTALSTPGLGMDSAA